MVYFLERIARYLYEQYGGNIRDHCLVFPSRRAGLYFLKYYAMQLDKPVWAPDVLTIGEFFSSHSDLIIADNEILLFELYKVYSRLNRSAESFDDFYFWGDMLINDFDDIDKYMADASVLFRNVQDLKDIDYQFGDIDPEKAEIIKKFWKNFEPEKSSPQKTGFISIWSIIYDLYINFRNSLRLLNIGYEGMIFRDVADMYINGKNDGLKWKKIHFVGFNALNKCEKSVMLKLQETGSGYFYWDYDDSYIKKGKLNSAGLFLIENLRMFKNDMPEDWNYKTFLTDQNTEITRKIVETTSEIAQVKLIPQLIRQISGLSTDDAHHTAVILADEQLIVPLLTSLPGNIGDINITMGYPLKMTGVYSLVRNILNSQRNSTIENGKTYFGYKDIFEILKHHLISNILNEDERNIVKEMTKKNLIRISDDFLCRSENLGVIFHRAADPGELSDHIREILSLVSAGYVNDKSDLQNDTMQKKLNNEFIYRVLLSVNRLETIVRSPDVIFGNETYIRILDKILRDQTVPFSGEPLSGIQVMGFLETRALDFRNIIMLSVNEGVLPSTSSGSSFIPYSIREAFGLPVINHQESIYAYHFFRLLHRAENVTFIYNSDSTGLRTGEMSRFLIQMKYEQILRPVVVNLNFDIRTPVSIRQEIEKEERHLNRLHSLYAGSQGNAILSPTAINTWLNCRMRFYYRYVNRLKEPEVISAEIDHALFGQILHRILKNVYQYFINKELSIDLIDSLLSDESFLLSSVEHAINESYSLDLVAPLSGNNIIVRDILFTYLLKILKTDRHLSPLTITELEQPFHFVLSFKLNGEIKKIITGGNIDRVDRHAGITRIVDYKTGTAAEKINSISDLFIDDRSSDLDGWLQTILYCEAYLAVHPGIHVRPSIYKVKELSAERFYDMLIIRENRNSTLPLGNYLSIKEDFLEGLKGVVRSIFSSEEPFRMTGKTNKCGYCPYRRLCQR